jgi:hypothetical protein
MNLQLIGSWLKRVVIYIGNPERLKAAAELIAAVASLVWPFIFLLLLLAFKAEFRAILRRLHKARFMGQEVELQEELGEAQRSVTIAAEEIDASRVEVVQKTASDELAVETKETATAKKEEESDAVSTVLQVAAQSPTAGLMLLSSYIDKQLRVLTMSMGFAIRPQPIARAAEALAKPGIIPQELAKSIASFAHVRNRVVHGSEAAPGEIMRAIDVGLQIFEALNSVPHEVNIVDHAGVPIYSDRACSEARPDVAGLILLTSAADTKPVSRIFPTTRTDYKKGQRVAWHWNLKRTWGRTWYREPSTGEIKDAWRESAEFIGDPIE